MLKESCEVKRESYEIKKVLGDMEMTYKYKLTESEYNMIRVYGITVEREYIKENKVIETERESINLISPKKEKVQKLLEVLYKGEVSPIHLIDIVGEYVDKCVYDFNEYENIDEKVI